MARERDPCVTFAVPGYMVPPPQAKARGRKRKEHWHKDATPEQVEAILRRISRRLWKATNVIVMTGAGISTSCGIPDFRSMNGIYKKGASSSQEPSSSPSSSASILAEAAKDGAEPRDLFHYDHVFSGPETFSEHLRFMAALKAEADAIPSISATHRFVGEALVRNGKLAKWLTQNIDGLELRSTDAQVCIDLPPGRCGDNARHMRELLVQLHGTVHELVCSRCCFRMPVGAVELARMRQGRQLRCPDCEAHDALPRNRSTPTRRSAEEANVPSVMRPAVVLYSEPSDPYSDADGDIDSHDRFRPSRAYEVFASDPLVACKGRGREAWPDFLLVIGTSLQIPGFQRIVRQLSRMTHARNGLVVMVNAEDVASITTWQNMFDYQVLGFADDWAKRVVQDWNRYESESTTTQQTALSISGPGGLMTPVSDDIFGNLSDDLPETSFDIPVGLSSHPWPSTSTSSLDASEDNHTARLVDDAVSRLNEKIAQGFDPLELVDGAIASLPTMPSQDWESSQGPRCALSAAESTSSKRPAHVSHGTHSAASKRARLSTKRQLLDLLEELPEAWFEQPDVLELFGGVGSAP